MTIQTLNPADLVPGPPTETAAIHGFWRVFAYPSVPGLPYAVDISAFRRAPTTPKKLSFADPFGPDRGQLFFPSITNRDKRGVGDLWWLNPFTTFQVLYDGPLPAAYPYGVPIPSGGAQNWWDGDINGVRPSYDWTGRAVGFSWAKDGLTVDLQGALYQLDDWLAKPEYPYQPYPYEFALAKQFLFRPNLRLRRMMVWWPSWWTRNYTAPPRSTFRYLIPVEVHPGHRWTGLTTRQTGSWDPTLTSYMQGLLSAMYTDRGRWTLDLMGNEIPVLLHRDFKTAKDDDVIVIDPNIEGVDVELEEDWLQSTSAVYGQGTSLAGSQYSGMQVSNDGRLTTYEPLAALRQVHPESLKNAWIDRLRPRREVLLQMQQGLDELQAQEVARAHQQRFGDPGFTGTVTVSNNAVNVGGVEMPGMLIRAGMSIQVPNILGRPEGVIAHVSNSELDFEAETNTLTVDTKYRDALTVSQVRARTRDAMQVQRMLVVGQYQPPVADQLIPWDYSKGSGMMPGGGGLRSQDLFRDMPNTLEFPWEDWTRSHPPRISRYRHCYASIGPASAHAKDNWAWVSGPSKSGRYGIPILAAQAATIRLLQVAAYDADGNVLPVSFHISFYTSRGVQVSSMPKIPAGQTYGTFHATDYYPFGKDAWNTFTISGTQLQNPGLQAATSTVGLIRGYGDYYERAGYWPGMMGRKTPKTGLLVDESPWQIDTTGGGNDNNVFDPYHLRQPKFGGFIYAMIYCDDQGSQPVYFLGRLFRQEPGATS